MVERLLLRRNFPSLPSPILCTAKPLYAGFKINQGGNLVKVTILKWIQWLMLPGWLYEQLICQLWPGFPRNKSILVVYDELSCTCNLDLASICFIRIQKSLSNRLGSRTGLIDRSLKDRLLERRIIDSFPLLEVFCYSCW